MLITVLTTAHPWNLFWPDNPSSQPTPFRSTLILSSHLYPRLQRYLMPSCFPDKPYRRLLYRHACYIPRLTYRHKLNYRQNKWWWSQLINKRWWSQLINKWWWSQLINKWWWSQLINKWRWSQLINKWWWSQLINFINPPVTPSPHVHIFPSAPCH